MAKCPPIIRLFVPGLLAMCASASAQDVGAQEERAQGRIRELFCLRLSLQIDDLVAQGSLPAAHSDELKGKGRGAVVAWLDDHPIKLQHQGDIAWTATPIQHEPFSKFRASKEWRAVLAGSLEKEQLDALKAQNARRSARVHAALVASIEERVARGLCLNAEEKKALAGVFEVAAKAQWEKGVVEEFQGMFGSFGGGGDSSDALRSIIDEAALISGLSPARRAIVEDVLGKGRTGLHDYQLEAEYYLYGRVDCDRERRLLYGLADAIVHRGGGKLKRGQVALAPTPGRKDKADWISGVRGILGTPVDSTTLPSRSKFSEGLRAEFLLAALDERACFSDQQRESLLPLMVALVTAEGTNSSGGGAKDLLLPTVLGVSADGLLVPGQNDSLNRASTKVRSLVKSFYENCSQEQRDVLNS